MDISFQTIFSSFFGGTNWAYREISCPGATFPSCPFHEWGVYTVYFFFFYIYKKIWLLYKKTGGFLDIFPLFFCMYPNETVFTKYPDKIRTFIRYFLHRRPKILYMPKLFFKKNQTVRSTHFSRRKNRPEKSPGGPNFLLHIQFFVFLYEEQISSRPADTDPCRTEPQRKPDP